MRGGWIGQLPLAAAVLAGCVQAPTTGGRNPSREGVPAFAPTATWYSHVERRGDRILYAHAGIANVERDAALLIGCTSTQKGVLLGVTFGSSLSIEERWRPVTLTLDGNSTLTQSWMSGDTGYDIEDFESGFAAVVEALKEHRSVTLVMGDSDAPLDRSSFTLDGAEAAIDLVISNCAKAVPD